MPERNTNLLSLLWVATTDRTCYPVMYSDWKSNLLLFGRTPTQLSHTGQVKSSFLNDTSPWPGGSVVWSIIPYTKKVTGLISGQGTYLSCRFYPWSPVEVCSGDNKLMFLSHIHVCLSVFFSLSLSSSSSLCKINKHILRCR